MPVTPNEDTMDYFTNSGSFGKDMYAMDLQHLSSASCFAGLGESAQQLAETSPASNDHDQPIPTVEEGEAQKTGNDAYLRPSRNTTIDEDYDDDEEGGNARETPHLPSVFTDFDTLFDADFDWLTDLQSSAGPECEAESHGTSQSHGISNLSYNTVPQVNSSPTPVPNQETVANGNTHSYAQGPGSYPATQYVPGLQGYSHPLAQAMVSNPRSFGGQTVPANLPYGRPAAYGAGRPYALSSASLANARPYQMPLTSQLCYVPNMDAYTGPGARSSFPRSNYAVPSQYYQQLQSLQQQNHAPTNLVQRQPTPPVQANQSPALPTAAGVQVGPRRLYFSSLEQAKNALENRIMSSNTTWEPNTADSTIPRHDTAQAQYVCQLVSAMEDVTAAQDSIRHWQHDPAGTKMPYYHPSHVEKVCWVLVSRAVQLHTRGPRTLATYDASALRNARLEQRLTFAQRINAICALLRYSKSRCDRLMKGETFEMVVGAPQHLLGQSRMNKNQNEVKQSRLRKGVEIEKKLRSEACPPGVGGDEGVVQKRAMESDDSEEDAVASSQRKRAKR